MKSKDTGKLQNRSISNKKLANKSNKKEIQRSIGIREIKKLTKSGRSRCVRTSHGACWK
jgi:hypothetical protein